MKNVFDPADLDSLQLRIAQLGPTSTRQWGSMSAAQALAHCSLGIHMASGDFRPKRKLIGRLLGPIIKPKFLRDDEPMRRNSPTVDELIITDQPHLSTEQVRLSALLYQFAAAGPKGCTDHPHAFFGPMTPAEWSISIYKHIDHHLRQFGV